MRCTSFHTLAFLAFMALSYSDVFAQSPQLINYQAVARNVQSGQEIANQNVYLQAIIRQNGPNGSIVYQEEHPDVLTNEYGLFNLQIGGGSAMSGSMASVEWAQGNFWLEIELDAGSGLQSMGSMQLVSVPYAMHATTVTNADDDDPDPTNELVGEFSFDPETSILTLTDAGGSYALDLSALIPDADSDPDNERISGVFYNAVNNSITITEGGLNYSSGLGPVDEDIDPTNELIDSNSFELLDNNILKLEEAGIMHSVDLSPLTESALWQFNSDGNAVFNTANRIGVGTELPSARLHVRGDGGPGASFSVEKEAGNRVFGVSGDTVHTSASSVLSIGGQERYKVTLLQGESPNLQYTLGDTESYIVILVEGTSSADVVMPPATEHPGRVLTIRRTGSPPLAPLSASTIQFDGIQPDIGSSQITMSDFTPQTVQLISAGEAGWIRLQ